MNNKRIVLITGGTKGIGLNITKALINENYYVIACSRNRDNVFDYSEISNISNFFLVNCDVSSEISVKKMFNAIKRKFLKIDILINNAGINETLDINKLDLKIWDNVIRTNLTGSFLVTKYFLELLKKGTNSRIINISSVSGRMGGIYSGLAYSASKGGLISLTYALAKKLAPYNITVNCISPGPIKTKMTEEYSNDILKNIPLNRLGNKDEVSEAVLYFCSENSGYTTGAVLDINGGMYMG